MKIVAEHSRGVHGSRDGGVWAREKERGPEALWTGPLLRAGISQDRKAHQ